MVSLKPVLWQMLGNCIQQQSKVTMSWTVLGIKIVFFLLHSCHKVLCYQVWSLNTVKTLQRKRRSL